MAQFIFKSLRFKCTTEQEDYQDALANGQEKKKETLFSLTKMKRLYIERDVERFLGFGGCLRAEEIMKAKIEMLASEQKVSYLQLLSCHSFTLTPSYFLHFFPLSFCLVVTILSASWLQGTYFWYSKSR